MAADVSARVHLVAEKLQQKAQDAQRKGNDTAARALSASVSDLRQAMALISEQRHLLARRRGEGDDEDDDADAHVQELAARLARVETMLGKKADDMKAKGNENAAAALQQSAAAVEKGRKLLAEQQQTIFGLLGRWEKLEDVVVGDKKRRRCSSDREEEEEKEEQDTEQGRLIARVRRLVQLKEVITEAFPGSNDVEQVQDEMEKLKKEAERLRQELERTKEKEVEAEEMLKQESLALEEAKQEMERMREREVVRQEEDAALLEQQRDACQAMEQLVRESDQEIQRMTQSAATRAEELQSLRIEIEGLASEKERLVRVHTDEIEELQGQLASAMDALSTKTDEGVESSAEELQTLQNQLDSLTSEKEELVKAHADEVEELRRQVEKATASISAKVEESAESNAEELQSLLATVDTLALEKEGLVKVHANEVEELQKAHAHEIEELRQKLESVVNDLSAKTEESIVNGAEDVQSLQTKVDNLTSEKEELAKSHADEVEELRKTHTDEIGDLPSQLESTTASLSTKVKKIDASNAEELQSLRDEVNNLMSEKENLAEIHDSELEKLRETYEAEIEGLHHQLDTTTADLSAKTKERAESSADELQQLRAEVGPLTIEKDHLVKEHAEEIENLNHQVERAQASVASVSGGHEGSTIDEDEDDGEHGDVPVMELEEDELQSANIAAEDEVEASSNDAEDARDFKKALEMQAALDDLQSQLAGYDEHSQTQQDTISELERERAELQKQIDILTSDKTQTVDERQCAHEVETLRMQADLDILQARVTEYEDRYQAQQNTISSLEIEQAELQERIEILINEKAQTIDELQSAHGEETSRLAQRLADSEGTIESLVIQLKEMKNTLAAKATEQSEAADALERCKVEFRACHSDLDAQIRECSPLKSDLEAVQDAEDAKSGEIGECLSQLTSELREMVIGFRSTGKMDAEAIRDFTGKVWQSPEVTELCSELAPLLNDLISTQDQLHTTEEELKLMCSDGDNQKLIIDQFLNTSDWRLFAKDDEEKDEVVGALDSDKDVCEHLAVAKANILRWLDELEQLRDRVEKDTVKINELEHNKLREQERLVALEESERDLQVLVESMREQLTTMRSEKQEAVKTAEKLKAQNHSASIQEQQQQAAQQEEVAELQQQLTTVRSDFERYRVRSHTALKKMEKRAELLNGMRKENEALLKQVKESDEQREQADAARKDSESRLQEVQRTQEMMQADFDQFAMEKSRVIAELEEDRERLVSEREQTNAKIQELAIKIQELETEKKQIEEESERIKEAELAAFQARLNTATVAVQTAKQDLEKVHDALEASKAENEKRQKLVESLELQLEEQSNTAVATDTDTKSPVKTNDAIPAPAVYVAPLASPSAEMAGLEKEVRVLRASEASLRKQLDDAQAELIALQERFATTKAANAEKVFALEEQSNHWKMELAAVTEEARRLTSVVEAQKNTMTQANGTSVSTPDQTKEALTTTARILELSEEIRELKTELADANTEITLLTRALDGYREELQEARNQLDVLAPSSSEPGSGEDSSAVSKATKVLAAKEEALKKLRVQILEIQDEMQTLREEKAALELEQEKEELDELQASRKHMQSEKERAMQLQRRQTLVSGFEKQVATIVDELQQRLEEHSRAFREVCDFRDEHRALLISVGGDGNAPHAGEPEFEEYLVMRSGVVIKAGASFQLPVICEKSGWRVVWSFSVKEDAADVSFNLSATMEDATSTEVEVVSPERMNEMSGVFQVRHDNTTLVFEWDNSFSWLNEKTLDYHVSIQEPLTPQAQKVRRSERELQTKAKLLEDGLVLIQTEAQRRSELSATLKRLDEWKATKENHLAEFGTRKTEVLTQKMRFQEEMDAQKAVFSALLREQDELEDVERSITRAWEAAVAEREDVEMTLQLAGNGAQLETLAHEIEEQAKSVAEQLKNPNPVEDTAGGEEEALLANAEDEVMQDHSDDAKLGDAKYEASTQQGEASEYGAEEEQQQ